MSDIIEPTPSAMIGEVAALPGPELPAGTEVVVEPVTEAAPVETPSETPAPEGEFEFDGQKFATEKDAFEFAKSQHGKVVSENLITEARMQGMQEAMFTNQQAPAVAEEAPVETPFDQDAYYADPIKYMQAREQVLKDTLTKQFKVSQAAADQDNQVWNEFFTAYPDLADFKVDVEAIANEHKQTVTMLSSRDRKKAMDFVALKTREKFQRYAEAVKPTRVLSNVKPQISGGVNQAVNPAPNATDSQEGLDMISQMRNMRKR